MPAKKTRHVDKVFKLMNSLTSIRNCSLIGHVDHGKTTLSDSLLASSGLLNPSLAGTALLLDFLDEEQERGITMKSTNISLVFKYNGNDVLINLVDTPGHVDFSGKVTRALRLIDVAIVVVDAVEGVMIQTEHVVRQALENGVQPLLYINKVDRLINELNLDEKEIQEKFRRLISDFNELIETHAPDAFKNKWKVNFNNESACFGSALDGWGATLSQFLKKYNSFSEVMSLYRESIKIKDVYQRREFLSKLKDSLPIHEAIIQMVMKNGKDPRAAQEYRIPIIWQENLDSELGKALLACDGDGPSIVFISKVQIEHNQLIATGRVFSGTVKKGDSFYLIKNGTRENVESIGVFMGHRIISAENVPAGNIIAIKGLKGARSGETLLDARYEGDVKSGVAFEHLSYLMEPVVTISIEPEKLSNLKKLQDIIEKKLIEDPNLRVEVSDETGEILLSGIGPLHLEVITNEIKKAGIPILTSEPLTRFHESIEKPSNHVEVSSINGKNKITLQLLPLTSSEEKIIKKIQSQVKDSKPSKHLKDLMKRAGISWSDEELDGLVYLDPENNMIINDAVKDRPELQALIEKHEVLLFSSFKSVLKHGPLVGESIRNLKIKISELDLAGKEDDRGIAEIIPMIRRAIYEAMQDSGVILLEPIFESNIYGSVENIGKITSLISQYNGKIDLITQEGDSIKIRAFFSVRKSFKLIEEAKNLTSGRVVFQNMFHGHEKVSGNEMESIISELKIKKGIL
ncbi:MAG: GTP-binding protein [Promethearchaeota archaeon]